MTGPKPGPEPETARVDRLIDENGAPLELPEDTALRATAEVEQAVGGTGPANWWRLGLLALGVVVVVLGLMQVLGRAPGTDVAPGTPVSEPISPQP